MDDVKYLTELIKDQYKSIRQFSIETGIPYTTIKSGLASGIGGMSVDTVIKMCNALGITVESLRAYPNSAKMTRKEERLQNAYMRLKNSTDPKDKIMADAIDRILGLNVHEDGE